MFFVNYTVREYVSMVQQIPQSCMGVGGGGGPGLYLLQGLVSGVKYGVPVVHFVILTLSSLSGHIFGIGISMYLVPDNAINFVPMHLMGHGHLEFTA